MFYLWNTGESRTTLKPELERMPTYAETMFNAYEAARLEASKISDREKRATHWLGKTEWFSDRLARACQIEARP